MAAEPVGPRSEAAALAVVFGLIWAAFAGLLIWLLRIPVMGHVLSLTAADILRALALVWALVLVLPLAGGLSRNPVRSAIASQVGFWVLLAALWILGPALPVAMDAVVVILVLVGFAQLIRCGTLRRRPLVAVGGAAALMAVLHVFTLLDMGYGQPLAVEAALMGQQNKDTLFHASITGFLSQYGVASAGFDGVSPLSYHILTHRLIAALTEWTSVVPLNAYALFLPILGAPLLITHLFWTYALISSGQRGNTTMSVALVEIMVLVLFCAEIGIKSFWVSETYIVSLWALLGALAIMGTGNRLSRANWALVGGTLAVLVLIASLAKISTGAVLACGVAVYVFAADGYRLRAFVAGAVLGLLPFLAVMVLAPVDSGHADQSFVVPFATLLRWPEKTVFHISLVIIFLTITLRHLRRPQSAAPTLFAIWTIMLAGIAASLLIYLEGASALYFANPALWAALCLLPLLGMGPVWESRRKFAGRTMVALALLVIINGQIGSLWSGLSHYRTQISETARQIAGRNNSVLAEALPLGQVVLAGLSSDGVFVPPNVTGFWQVAAPCWSALQVVPAIAATPMLMGLPASETGCMPDRFYGFGGYSLDVSTQRKLDDQDICEVAATRNMQVVSVVQADLSVRKLACPE